MQVEHAETIAAHILAQYCGAKYIECKGAAGRQIFRQEGERLEVQTTEANDLKALYYGEWESVDQAPAEITDLLNKRVFPIPFSGFYNSLWDSVMDHFIEQEAESLVEQARGRGRDMKEAAAVDLLFRHFDGARARLVIAQLYVGALQEYFKTELGAPLDIEFLRVDSPHFYNFETDRIEVSARLKAIESLWPKLDEARLAEELGKQCTTRSGFISFYSNDLEEWKEKGVAGFDFNELGVFLCALLPDDFEEINLFYEVQSSISEKLRDSLDWCALEPAIEKLEKESPAV